MPTKLKRFHQSRQTHFITFTCYHRLPYLETPTARDIFLNSLERSRIKYSFCIYAYVVMPEHIHLLISEPSRGTLAQAIQSVKLSSSKQIGISPFWQARYYDRNIRDYDEFTEKLRYIHRNPVKRGLCASAIEYEWSSFRHYAAAISGAVEIESQWNANRRAGRETEGYQHALLI